MKWNTDIESAPRNAPLILLVQEREGSVAGFGSIEKLHSGERLSFSYVEHRSSFGTCGIVGTQGRRVDDVVGWRDYPASHEEVEKLEPADKPAGHLRRVIHLEEALGHIRDRADIAADFGHFDMLVSSLRTISDEAHEALKVKE